MSRAMNVRTGKSVRNAMIVVMTGVTSVAMTGVRIAAPAAQRNARRRPWQSPLFPVCLWRLPPKSVEAARSKPRKAKPLR